MVDLGPDILEIGQLYQIARDANRIRESTHGLLDREQSVRNREGSVEKCKNLIGCLD